MIAFIFSTFQNNLRAHECVCVHMWLHYVWTKNLKSVCYSDLNIFICSSISDCFTCFKLQHSNGSVCVCVCVCHCYGAYLCGIHKMQAVKIKQTNKAPLNTNNEKWNRRQWHCNIVSFVSFFRSFLRYGITMLSIATSNQIEKQSVWRERITYLVLILACIYLYFL